MKEKQEYDEDEVYDVIDPSRSSGTLTPVARSDLRPKVIRLIRPFKTWGNEMIRVRAPYSISTISQSNTVNVFGALYFSLNSYPGASSAAAFFDQYRIMAVSVRFAPQYTGAYFVNGSINPRLYTVLDYDDANTPTSIGYLQQYASCITAMPDQGITRVLRPRIALANYSGAFSSFSNVEPTWIDVASPNTQHYGVKYAIDVGAGGQTTIQSYSVDVVLYVEFRSVR